MTDKTVEMELEDLMDGRRKFEIEFEEGDLREYFISTPSADVIRKADWEYAKTYNQALKEGVFTSSEMLEILKTRNIIGSEYDKTADELKVNLAEKIIAMERETDKDKRFALALEVANLREEVFQWNQRLTGPMASTCEEIANHVRIEYLTSCIIEDKDSNRIWETFEDYRNEKDLALQAKSRFEVMLWVEGLDSDFLDRAPENAVIKEVVDGLQEKEDEEAVSVEISKEDEDVDEVLELQPPKKKTESKKKKTKKKAVKKKASKDKASADSGLE